jgi:Bacterial transcriptional activator domain
LANCHDTTSQNNHSERGGNGHLADHVDVVGHVQGWQAGSGPCRLRCGLVTPEWAHTWRRRLEDHRIRAVECMADAELRRGLADAAIRSAELVLELDSLRETAWQILIRSHTAAGNPASALRAYQRCHQVLRQQLGTAPSPRTRAALAGLSR